MKPDLVIQGGRIIDPGQKLDKVGNLLVSKDKISKIDQIEPSASPQIPNIIDATGLIVCPGFIDLHCHLREPGFEEKETIRTGTRAAAAGGFTTICCMPNTNPPLDNKATIDYVKNKSSFDGIINVLIIGCITRNRQGKELAEMYELAEAGVIGFSDDGEPVQNARMLQMAMEYSKHLKLPIIDHCEDKELANGGFMNEGWVSNYLGLKGIPAAAEENIVARDLSLAKLTGAKVHIAHVSTVSSIELIRRAKAQGISVTAEVTPHHLTLSEERITGTPSGKNTHPTYDTNAKVNPPLRTRQDIEALIIGLKDGTIDAIATDHAPHTSVDKLCEFGLAAFGISGFETAFGCLMDLVHNGQIDILTLISKLTTEPAGVIQTTHDKLGSLKIGCPADITLIDPDKEWVVNTGDFLSKGKNNPFNGYKFKGKVVATIRSGNIVYSDPSMKVTSK
jgi:dihydroorotase